MSFPKSIKNVVKILEKPFRETRLFASPSAARKQKPIGFSLDHRSESSSLDKSAKSSFERSGFYTVPLTATSQEAEIICNLLSKIGNSRDIDSALNSSDSLIECVSPNLVLEVLKKLNNAGAKSLYFFRWAERRKGFQHAPDCYHAVIESLGKIKQFKMVWSLVDEMKSKDLLGKDTFALVSRRLVRANKVKEAIDAFEKMDKSYGLKHELQDYNWLLDILSKSEHVAKAQELFDKRKNKEFKPDIKSYTTLLEGWGEERNFLRVDEVCRDMKEDGFEPDAVCYGILINAYCKAGKYDKAIKMYDEMVRKNIKPTPHIYCTLINGLGSVSRLDEAIEFFNLCKNSDCGIETPTYNAMVGAHCWSGDTHDAYRLVAEMRKYGIGPDSRTHDIILRHLVRLRKTDEAYDLFRKMNHEFGCEPTLSTYEIILRMFCNEGNTDMAVTTWDQMKAKGIFPGMHLFSTLVSSLCYENKLDEACNYLLEMIDIGMRPPDRLFKHLKRFLIKDGREDIVIILAHRIEKLRNTLLLFG